MEALFRGTELEAFFQPGAGELLLITFAPLDFKPSAEMFWGQNFAIRANLPAIGITPLRSSWYPEKEMVAVARAAAPVLSRFPSRITYGSSMGAYGAIKYGNLLRASACAAFGPQVSINPADGVTSQAYTRYYQPDLHSEMIVQGGDVCPNAFIFFDPRDEFDQRNANHVSSVAPASTLVRLVFCGHECIKVVAGVANMTALLHACIVGDKQSIRNLCRRLRSTSPARYAGLASELVSRKPALASSIMKRYGSAFDPKQTALFYEKAAIAHMTRKDFTAAEAAARAALSFFPERTSFIRTLGIIHERAGALHLAAECYRSYLRLNPIDLALYHALARVHAQLQDYEKAESVIREALKVSQTHVGILRLSSIISASQGRLNEAICRLDHAARLNPDDDETFLSLAELLSSAGRIDEAVIAIERAIVLRPKDVAARERLRDLRAQSGKRIGNHSSQV